MRRRAPRAAHRAELCAPEAGSSEHLIRQGMRMAGSSLYYCEFAGSRTGRREDSVKE